ncbi:caspase activity and apoptosis inhibitor 1 isoform X2 [Salmo trutta]|uniref:caspase activity and apoptosis inhibitor 1 isoform X2 n=1 Tax=Salmo trutta TaxID=8032 RepID=UPI00113181F8|nr:caspase activity and apoptosis inhibitor 1 isoform X2 [Salmo trutta]
MKSRHCAGSSWSSCLKATSFRYWRAGWCSEDTKRGSRLLPELLPTRTLFFFFFLLRCVVLNKIHFHLINLMVCLVDVLKGEELTGSSEGDRENGATDSQQDNNVDSTSSLKESVEVEIKQEGGGSEESDVLSINADTYDSDIEGHKDEPSEKTEEAARTLEVVAGETSNPGPSATPAPADGNPFADKPPEPKKELQKDIDKSVSEILALASTPDQEDAKKQMAPPLAAAPESSLLVTRLPTQSAPIPGPAPAPSQPSAQQLELLELEMRARAIKALMKANDVKKQT